MRGSRHYKNNGFVVPCARCIIKPMVSYTIDDICPLYVLSFIRAVVYTFCRLYFLAFMCVNKTAQCLDDIGTRVYYSVQDTATASWPPVTFPIRIRLHLHVCMSYIYHVYAVWIICRVVGWPCVRFAVHWSSARPSRRSYTTIPVRPFIFSVVYSL